MIRCRLDRLSLVSADRAARNAAVSLPEYRAHFFLNSAGVIATR
jgi:hypothetical protein